MYYFKPPETQTEPDLKVNLCISQKLQIAEIDILIQYNLETTQQGIKVHSNADKVQLEAVQRLFDKGLVTSSRWRLSY